MEDMIKKFDEDMESATLAAKRLGYNPTIFLSMAQSRGFYHAVKQLIHAKNPQAGLTKLWKLGHLELSIEAHVIKSEFAPIFTVDERKICIERLESFGYKPQ